VSDELGDWLVGQTLLLIIKERLETET